MHKHKFKNIGGGCMMQGTDPKKCCDDTYKCECGEKFTVYSSMTGHQYLPEVIESEEMSEIKKAEQEAINNALVEQVTGEDYE